MVISVGVVGKISIISRSCYKQCLLFLKTNPANIAYYWPSLKSYLTNKPNLLSNWPNNISQVEFSTR